MKAPPPSTKANLTTRLNGHIRTHWPSLAGIDIRFRANFAYIDGRYRDGTILKLCRLRYGLRPPVGLRHLSGQPRRLRKLIPPYRHTRRHRRRGARLRLWSLPRPFHRVTGIHRRTSARHH
jgi:hypothetical protein